MNYKKSGARVLAAVLALLLLAGCGLAAGPQTEASPAPSAAVSAAPEVPVEPGADNVVRVTNVDELLAAIAPNTTIRLAAGDYALYDAKNYGGESHSDYYEWTREYDGPALVIRGVHDLVITGEGADKVTLTAEPRYANVLRFVSCENVTVEGLTAGHTQEPGLCSGGVLRFEVCRGCTVRGCGLFGCGTIGVWADDCSRLTVEDTDIYECSYAAVLFSACRDVRVRGGEVYGCGTRPDTGDAMSLFDLQSCESAAVSGVRVHDNSAQVLLSSHYSRNVFFVSNEVTRNRLAGAFSLVQFAPVVDGCRFEENGDLSWYLFETDLFASDLDGNALVGDAFGKMTLREIDPDAVLPTAAPAPGKEVAPGAAITVKTVDEFIEAIGPERTIVLDGELFDLSAASDYGSAGGRYYYWYESFDGPELVIDNVSGLTIRAASDDPKAVTVSAVPRYANVLAFKNCDDLTLVGFTAGHAKEPGSCAGGVLKFDGCHKVTVDGCRLYGCGILGVQADRCTTLRLLRTEIYECSIGAAQMNHTDGIAFVDCDIHDVPDPALVFGFCGDVTWNGEPLTGDRYDMADGRLVDPGAPGGRA